MQGKFDIAVNNTADNMLVYCLDADEKPHFISAITTNNGAFTEAGKASYTVSETALPQDLVDNGNLALPQELNFLYIGSREGDRPELVAAFKDPANYQGRSTPYSIVTSGAAASKQMTTSTISTLLLMTVSAVAVVTML